MSPYKHLPMAMTAEELDDVLARAAVDKAVCWLTPQGVDDVADSNRYIYDKTKALTRFVPFGWANVMEGVDKAMDDVRVCLDEYGFRGVKLNGAQNYYPIDSLSALKVCEQIAKRGKIIAFHIGSDEPTMTSAHRAAVVANEFPDTPIVMIHMGGASADSHNVSRTVIEVAKLCPNMMLIGSAIEPECVKVAIDELGPERVMFGSDTPFRDPAECVAGYEQMLAPYAKAVRDQVMYGTAMKLFC